MSRVLENNRRDKGVATQKITTTTLICSGLCENYNVQKMVQLTKKQINEGIYIVITLFVKFN